MGMMINRRRVMGGKNLPYDAEIEYLESSGTQYIDTDFVPLIGDSFHVELSCSAISTVNTLFNAGTGTYQLVVVLSQTGNQFIRFFSSNSPYGRISLELNKWYTLDITAEGNVSFGGLTWKAPPAEELDGNDTDLWLYKRHNLNNPFFGKIKNFIVERNGKSRLHLIPVRIGNVGYMYDKVSGRLFGNAGTGDFILGPDKNSVTIITQQQQHEMYG